MWFKKMLSVITVCSLFVTLGGISYATPTEIEQIYSVNEKGYTINKENETDVTYVTVHEIPETIDVEIVDKQTGKSLFKEKNIPFLDVLSYAQKQNKGERKKRYAPAIPIVFGIAEKAVTTFGMGAVMYASHKMEQSKGPVGKPNRKKQGRERNEKKQLDDRYKGHRAGKDPNRPMKKHTPSKRHKGGK
jgi:hypothetical protein